LAARKVYSRDVRGRIGKERFVPASERMVVIAESCVKVQGGADDPTVLPVGSSMLSCATSNIAFADHGPRWRERLGEITAPTLVLHGEDDRFFPIGNGEALAAEIPNDHLVRLDPVGHWLPAHAVTAVTDDLLAHRAG
jgi:pimeloyl-ACP methyl ester carboxylesterase